jgi:hypothetical protein
MDYAIDFYNGNNEIHDGIVYPEFIYDDRRICSKIYVIFKLLSLIFYLATLPTCNSPNFYIGMVFAMFLSAMNSARYEYAHFKRYGTTFSSVNEYVKWKNELWPKSRIFFHAIEVALKTVYFMKNFPPLFDFNNLCEIGESVLKIHILALFIIYVISAFFTVFIIWMIYCVDCFNYRPSRRREPASLRFPIIFITNQPEECCICLDMDNIREWSILPCGHKFHNSCVSTWLLAHQTCPVCRLNVIPIS